MVIYWWFIGDLLGFNGDLLGFNGDLLGFYWILWEMPSGKLTYLWKDPPFFIGNSTKKRAMFNRKKMEHVGFPKDISWIIMIYPHKYGKIHHCFVRTSTISMAIFSMANNVSLPEGKSSLSGIPLASVGVHPRGWSLGYPRDLSWTPPFYWEAFLRISHGSIREYLME